MTRLLPSIALILSVAAPTLATPQASENGECPPPLSSPVSVLKRAEPTPPTNGMHYLGAVTVSVALSDTGHICAVDVVKGIEPALDKQAIDAIRQQPFQPIRVVLVPGERRLFQAGAGASWIIRSCQLKPKAMPCEIVNAGKVGSSIIVK